MKTDITELVARLRAASELAANRHILIEAADALQQQAERITAFEAKDRLYEASLDKADAEVEGLKRERDIFRTGLVGMVALCVAYGLDEALPSELCAAANKAIQQIEGDPSVRELVFPAIAALQSKGEPK